MTSLEGFGSADVTTPFHYGSVADGIRHNPSLEQKLKKKYWKTKQTVIQKLNKSQDEFVVAGDADIDTKLEIAYHLRSSCHQLLHTLEKCCFRLRDMSAQELAFGEYLGAYSEREYTNAGQVMKSTGRVLELEAKARLTVLPGLQRLYQEMATFEASALSDLTLSIQTLERARTDYRAALLWMKDVSGKLHNPDYHDQLVRFREAQAAVKEAKLRFDKLKIDLTEKIGMVNASRCNLLSRSLPTYQKAMLAFSDSAAAEFHQVLVNLRSHHHHQYKLHSDMEVIRDLEAHEFTESQLLSTLEGGDSTSPPQSSAANDDVDLLDVSSPTGPAARESMAPEVGKEPAATEEVKEGALIPLSPPPPPLPAGGGDPVTELAKQQAAIANDLPLNGVEADLRALQKELLQEFGSSSPPRDSSLLTEGGATGQGATGREKTEGEKDLRSADMDLTDLLGLGLGLEGDGGPEGPDFGPLVSSEGAEPVGGEPGEEVKSSDVLADRWNNFSSFMSSTRSQARSSLSEWEKEFAATQPPSEATERDPFEDLDPLAAARKQAPPTGGGQGLPTLADSLLSLDMSATAPSAMVPSQSLLPAPVGPPPALPPAFSQPHPPPTTAGAVGRASNKPHPPPKSSPATGKQSGKKGGSWMNVFAHLDPLSNEKV